MSDHGGTYRVKVFYDVETRDSGIVEETGIIRAKDQEEYTHELNEFKNRLARQWGVSMDRIKPRTAELLSDPLHPGRPAR